MNAQGITKALGGRWHGSYGTAKGSTAKQITDVRDAARQHTLAAVETLVSVMQDLKAPHSARVAAANGILDRGYGKAVQHIEAEVSVYDSLTFAEKEALLAVLESLDVDEEGAPAAFATAPRPEAA